MMHFSQASYQIFNNLVTFLNILAIFTKKQIRLLMILNLKYHWVIYITIVCGLMLVRCGGSDTATQQTQETASKGSVNNSAYSGGDSTQMNVSQDGSGDFSTRSDEASNTLAETNASGTAAEQAGAQPGNDPNDKNKSNKDAEEPAYGPALWVLPGDPGSKELFKSDPKDPDPPHDEFTAVDKEAEALNMDAVLSTIKYPPDAKRDKIQGKVYLKLLIDRNGIPKDYYIRRSPDMRLSRAVVDKLRNLKYTPATLKGKPIKTWVELDYEFRL